MKRNKITAVILSIVMSMSLMMPSAEVLADEATAPSETQKTETVETKEPKATEKQTPKETEKQESRETTKPKETAKPKETEKPAATQATEKPVETEAPKETEKPVDTGSGDAEQSKETEPSATPAETGSGDAEQPKETEHSATPAETGGDDAEQPKETEPSETPAETGESEAKEPKETEETKVPEESGNGDEEPEESKGDKVEERLPDDTVNTPAKDASLNAKITNKILTFDAVPGAVSYELYIYNEYLDPQDIDDLKLLAKYAAYIRFDVDAPRQIDLGKTINRLIKEGELSKSGDNYYYINLFAWGEGNGNRLAGVSGYTYHETSARKITVKDITATFSNGKMSWKAVKGAVQYLVTISNNSGSYSISTTGTSIPINQAIDLFITNNKLIKCKYYDIEISAYDSDEAELAYCWDVYVYTYYSSAVPNYSRSISASISGDYLSYTEESYATDYKIRIVDSNQKDIIHSSYNPFNLKDFIESYISLRLLMECPSYTIELYARDADGNYVARWTGTYNYKDANTLSVAGKAAKVKYNKKKKKTVKRASVIKISDKGQGAITYKKVSGNSKFTVNSKTGNITVKKKLKKKTYTIKVKVIAAGNETTARLEKIVTIKIKLK